MIMHSHIAAHHFKMNEVSNGMKTQPVQVNIMPKTLLKHLPLFEPAVDALVQCPGLALCTLFWIVETCGGEKKDPAVVVATICYDHLPCFDLVQQLVSGNSQVTPLATRMWTVQPDHLPALNAHANLVSDTSSMELVTAPFGVEWHGFLNSKIRSINRDQTDVATVAFKAVFEKNLRAAETKL